MLECGALAALRSGGGRLAFLVFVVTIASTAVRPSAHAQTVTLAVSPTKVAEGSGATDVRVTATLAQARTSPTSVTVTLGGEATAGTDYRTPGSLPTITIPANQTEAEATVILTPIDDNLWEGSEAIRVGGTASGGASVSEASVTLEDNDTKPSILVSVDAGLSIDEASGTASLFTVRAEFRNGSLVSVDTSVTLSTRGTATLSTDYTLAPLAPTITIPAGKSEGTVEVSITPIDNDSVDSTRDIYFGGSATDRFGTSFAFLPTGLSLHRIVILDDEAASPIIRPRISPTYVRTGDLDLDSPSFNVTLSAVTDQTAQSPVSVQFLFMGALGCNEPSLSAATAVIPSGERESNEVTATLRWDSRQSFDRTCGITISATAQGHIAQFGQVAVVPSTSPRVLSALIEVGSGLITEPASVLNLGEELVLGIQFSRGFVSSSGLTPSITVLIGTETRTVSCRPVSSFGFLECVVRVQLGDRDLDGVSMRDVTLTIPGDTVDFFDQTVAVTVDSSIPPADLDQHLAVQVHGGATSFDLSPSLQSAQEGIGPTEIEITAKRAGGLVPAADLRIPIVVRNGTADEADYEVQGEAIINVPRGSTSGTASLTFTPIDDGVKEARVETLTFEAGETEAFVIGAEFRIIDAPFVRLSATPASISEDGGPQSVTVRAELGHDNDAVRPRAISVRLSFAGSASLGDYSVAPRPAVVTIPPNQRFGTATLTFSPVDDLLLEGDESVELSGSTPGLSVVGSPVITIEDDETEPQVVLRVTPKTIREDDEEATQITVSAELGPNLALQDGATLVSLTLGGTATAGSEGDYSAVWSSQTPQLTIPARQRQASTTLTLTVTPHQDEIAEGNETIVVEGTASRGLVVDVRDSGITLVDDDIPGIVLDPSPLEVEEGGMTGYSVALARRPAANVTVRMTTSLAGTDLTLDNTEFSFTPDNWDTPQPVSVTAAHDEDAVADAPVALTHAASGGAYSGVSAELTVTIKEDETPNVVVSPTTLMLQEGGSGTYSVKLTAQPTQDVTVKMTTDLTGTDATVSGPPLTFTAQNWDKEQSVTVTAATDADELNESAITLTHSVSGGEYEGVSASSVTVSIIDTTLQELSVTGGSAQEGSDVSFTVSIPQASPRRIQVAYATSDGTANQPGDYTATSGTLTLEPGQTSKTVTVKTAEDTLDEPNETFQLGLSSPVNAVVKSSAATATGTITDNDAAPTAITLGVSPASVAESANATSITVTASLVGSQRTAPTAVTVRQTGGTATSGTDYTAISNFTVTIAAGASSGTATLSFDPTEDALDEPNETVVLTGSGPAALGLTAGTATLTITDNDAAPTAVTLGVSPASAAESASATSITVTASLVGTLRGSSTAVTVRQTGGTAISGTDYTAISNFTVTIAAGARSGTATLSFDPTEDTLDEPNETVILTGEAPSGLSLTAGTATLTITDNDAAPTAVTVGVSPASVAESANATSITVTASLVGSQRTAATAVTVRQTGGTATSGTDYAAISSFTVTIAAGASSGTATLSFDPTEDALDEPNETAVLTGSGPDALGLTAGTATLTITDNDDPPTAVTLGVSPASALESANATSITVTASLVGTLRGSSTAVTVRQTGGTATSGTDYAAISSFTVTIAAGARSGTATLSFNPTEDTLDEPNETVILTGSAPASLSLTAGTATLTITDNDDPPTAVSLAVSPASVAESANATSITVTASLVGSQRTAATAVTVRQTGGTATSGTDYAAISSFTVTIAAGASSGTATLSFDPTEDALDEPNETVVLTGSGPAALGLTAGTATLTITDNDTSPTAVTLGVSPASALESANATDITVTASLVGTLRGSATAVTVRQTGGTATSGTDYTAIGNFTVTVAAGARSGTATLSFDPTEDTLDEPNETVILTGEAPSALSLTAGTATLTITDNDAAPTAVTVGVSPASVAESANATSITVTASLVGSQRTAATAVTVRQTGGTATSGTDYTAISNFTVTIAAGATSGTATLSFDPTEDALDEPNETVILTGSASGLTAGTATLTITDNDDPPTAVTLAVSPTSVAESAAATSITVTASLVGTLRGSATAVTVSQTGGTATSGTDYTAIGNFTVTIAAGARSGTATLSFNPTEDTLDEPNETVILTGSAPASLSLTAGTATLTITDNDDPPTAVSLAVSPASVAESANATSITVTASLVGSQRTAATAVTVRQTGGTATSGTDYAAISSFTVTIAAGASSGTATLSFDPTEDALDEPNETVVLTGSGPAALGLTAGTATLTITDNDDPPTAVTLAVSPTSVAESAAATSITVTASLVGTLRGSATAVTVSQTGGTATSGTDYTAIGNFTVTIAAGARSGTATLSFNPTEDTLDEPNETVILTGSAPASLSLTAGTATLTITDNDDPPTAVSLAVSPASVAESANATSITVTASLVGSQRTAATAVTVRQTGGTATSGTDYAAISSFTVTIAAGASSGTATLSFDPTEDALDEPNETVVLTGSGPAALGLTAGTATLTITDNDTSPTAVTLGVSPASALESANATDITVTASLVGTLRGSATAVTVRQTGGTATSGTDYTAIGNFTVTVAAGARSGTATLSFDPTEDTLDEPNETVILTGEAPSALSLTAGTATLTITDNDAAPTAVTLGVSPASVAESANATSITVTASLVGSQRTAATAVTVRQTGGTATSGTDYTAISNFTVTIAAGASSGTATLSFDPTEDALDEPNETVILTGSASGLTAGTATLTITDNDDPPTAVTLAVSPTSVAESAAATSITVTASLVGTLRGSATAVTVSQTGGTATSGTDYTAIGNFTVTIAAGARSGTATLSFAPTEDTLDEPNETVILTGSAPTALSLTASTATLTINDNDGPPTAVTLGVNPSSAAESANATSITVTASLVGSQRTADTAVTVSQTGGTATSGTDYAAISNFTVTIAAGASSGTATLSFDPTEDALDEPNETVILTGSASGLTAGTATLTITDNDDPPTAVTLAVSPTSVAESAAATSITVTASLVGTLRGSATAVTVSQTGGTATSGTDYTAIGNFTVTIAAGARSGTATLSFAPTEDTLDEPNETVILTGSAPTALSLTAGTATLTINDNDGPPTAVTLGVNPSSAAESANATSITVTASLVGSQRTADTAVTVSQTGGTATSGTDYAAISNFTVTIAAGASSGTATLSFDPTEDALDEPNETVILTGSASGLTAGTATLTITDNDDPPTAVTLAVSPTSVAESAAATSITVTASLVGTLRGSATAVTVSQTGGTATSGTDYTAIGNFTVTIAAGARSGTATLSFAPTEDTLDEPNETVILTGGAPTALSLTAGTATLTINDNDGPPTAVTLAVNPSSAAESANATSITVTASLVGSQRTADTAVTVSQTGGTATSGTDYAAISNFTVTIAAGATSGTATLSFDPTEDALDEPNETVILTGSASGLTAGTATLTITDNDDPPTAVTLAVSPTSVAESAAATSITVTASLVGTLRGSATAVTVGQTGGTATSGTDYTAIGNFTVTIAAGARSGTATLSFAPTEDTLDEPNETVILTGGAPDALSLTAGTATLTINDNDGPPTAVTLAVNPSSAAESANATSITVTASLVGSQRTADTAVTVSQTGGTATSGTDYAAISNFTVTIAAGATSGTATLSFDPTEDALDEPNETVVLTGSASGLTAGTATLTITDNDDPPTAVTLAVSPTSVAESAAATSITVTASLVGTLRGSATAVTVGQSGGTATSGTDYTAIGNFTVTIAAGARSGTATLSFAPTEDTLDEPNETVILTGGAPDALSLTAGTATLTINDNDGPPTAVTLAVNPSSAAESANATSITVTASLVGSQRTADTAVTVSQTGGTATSGTDYAAISNFTVTIAAGATSGTATLSFDPTEDALDEPNETVVLTGSASGLTAGTATLTITDNDDPPTAVTLAVSPTSVAESAAATSITVTASLVGTLRGSATAVTVSQSGGTATSGTDYTAIGNFTVTIAAGARSGTATLSFAPTEDTLDEPNETVILTGGAPDALSLTAGTATLTINDNDGPPTAVTLAVNPSSAAESANATSITVTASLAGSQRTADTAVTVSQTGGTATSGTDYAAISNFTVTIAAGATSGTATLSFDPTEDALDEPNETVVLTGSASGLTAGTATLTITDNDDPPTAVTLAVSPTSVAESAAATSIMVTASLVGTLRGSATAVTVSQSGGTATSGTDYTAIGNFTVTIAAGARSGTATLSFAPTEDTLDEPNETVILTGSAPTALSLTAGTATLTINDNDGPPTAVTLAVNPSSAAESANATSITVTASLAGSQRTADTAVTVSQTGGTATSGTDYAAISNFTVTIAAGATSGTATLSFDPTEDALDEPNETVILTGSASGLTAGTATLTITDNDDPPTAVTLAVNPTSVAESAAATSITVTASLVGTLRGSATAVTVSQTGGTATSGTDYTAIGNFTVTIAAGARSGTATLSFDPTEDTLVEDDETVVLTGTGPAALGLTAGTATLTISDNDGAPTAVTLAASPATVAESADATSITVTASLVGAQRTVETAVTVSRTGGTATSGTDYAAISNFTVTIAAGATSGTATLSFDPTEDTVDEEDETVVLTGTGPAALGLTAGTATLTITDNDGAPTGVGLAVNPASASESAGATSITVTASLVGSRRTSDTAVTVSQTGGTATSGTDYAPIGNLTVTIAAEAASGTATLAFEPADDVLAEESETVVLTGTASGLTAGTATLTILDNDGTVTLSVTPHSIGEGAPPTEVTVRAGTNRSVEGPLAISVRLEPLETEPAVEYSAVPESLSITIPDGADSGSATLMLSPVEDSVETRDARIRVTGTADSPDWGIRPATLLVVDNDGGTGVPERGPPAVRLWTERLGYRTDEQVRLYLDIDPHGDEREYTVFFYLENIATGERQYLAPRTGSRALRDDVVDQDGQVRGAWRVMRLERIEELLAWEGEVPQAGLWHFVAELRSPGTTQVLKRAWAKFVVAGNGHAQLYRSGSGRAIRTDMRLANDTVHHLRGTLRVGSGATLVIEPGTLIQAWGTEAAIVVEPGGRILARGRREAPVVMTCDAPMGQRFPGCWGGLRVRGKGGRRDSSGELRYLRVEFAGGASAAGAPTAALAFEDVGGATRIDRVQAHASLGDGLAFVGGTAHCGHCVASDTQGDSLAWSGGWRGSAQHLYVRQGAQASAALRGRAGAGAPPAGPALRNVTLVGGYMLGAPGGAPGTLRSIGPGIVLEGEATVTLSNVLAAGFGGPAIDAPAASFAEGRSRIAGALLSHSGYRDRHAQVRAELEPWVQYTHADPDLVDIRHGANPDPRPRSGSAARKLGTAVAPPFDPRFAAGADHAGAFGGRNWLEEWTFFGPERDYVQPGRDRFGQSRRGALPAAAAAGADGGAGGPQGGGRP